MRPRTIHLHTPITENKTPLTSALCFVQAFYQYLLIIQLHYQKQIHIKMKFTVAFAALSVIGASAFAPAPAGRAATAVFNETPEK